MSAPRSPRGELPPGIRELIDSLGRWANLAASPQATAITVMNLRNTRAALESAILSALPPEEGERRDTQHRLPEDMHPERIGMRGGWCFDCGLDYGGPAWIEAVIPDDVWAKIAPREGKYGLLCITCIARRLARLGLEKVPVRLCGTEPLRAESGEPSRPLHPEAMEALERLAGDIERLTGGYLRDQLTFAINTIEDMKALAAAALVARSFPGEQKETNDA